MIMTDKEYIEAVHELNSELFDKHNETEWSFWYRTNGYADQIGFEDFVVWCSEANGTQYNEETGEEMPILDVIRESVARYAEKFNRLTTNELAAVRDKLKIAEEALGCAIRESQDIRKDIRSGHVSHLVTIENSFYVIQDGLEEALTAIRGERETI